MQTARVEEQQLAVVNNKRKRNVEGNERGEENENEETEEVRENDEDNDIDDGNDDEDEDVGDITGGGDVAAKEQNSEEDSEEGKLRSIQARLERMRTQRKVMVFDTRGTYLSTYKSGCEAARLLGVTQSSVSECCRGKRKAHTCQGFIFRFQDELDMSYYSNIYDAAAATEAGESEPSSATAQEERKIDPSVAEDVALFDKLVAAGQMNHSVRPAGSAAAAVALSRTNPPVKAPRQRKSNGSAGSISGGGIGGDNSEDMLLLGQSKNNRGDLLRMSDLNFPAAEGGEGGSERGRNSAVGTGGGGGYRTYWSDDNYDDDEGSFQDSSSSIRFSSSRVRTVQHIVSSTHHDDERWKQMLFRRRLFDMHQQGLRRREKKRSGINNSSSSSSISTVSNSIGNNLMKTVTANGAEEETKVLPKEEKEEMSLYDFYLLDSNYKRGSRKSWSSGAGALVSGSGGSSSSSSSIRSTITGADVISSSSSSSSSHFNKSTSGDGDARKSQQQSGDLVGGLEEVASLKRPKIAKLNLFQFTTSVNDKFDWATISKNTRDAVNGTLSQLIAPPPINEDGTARSILVFNLLGEYMGSFRNGGDASRAFGVTQSLVSQCINGRINYAQGRKFLHSSDLAVPLSSLKKAAQPANNILDAHLWG